VNLQATRCGCGAVFEQPHLKARNTQFPSCVAGRPRASSPAQIERFVRALCAFSASAVGTEASYIARNRRVSADYSFGADFRVAPVVTCTTWASVSGEQLFEEMQELFSLPAAMARDESDEEYRQRLTQVRI